MQVRENVMEYVYEKIRLRGQEAWGTGAVLDHSTVPGNLYCYDVLRDRTEQGEERYYISMSSVDENCAGTLLTGKPLDFRGQNMIDAKEVQFYEDEPLQTIKNILQDVLQQSQAFCTDNQMKMIGL